MIRWVAAVMAFLTTGCATVQSLRFEQPDFDLTSVRVDPLFSKSSLASSSRIDLASQVDHLHS